MESYFFIDGNCLNCTLTQFAERYFKERKIQISYDALARNHRKVYYYDAVPVRRREESADAYEKRVKEKRDELSLIARQDSYHVRTGDAHERKRRGREQKMVDVQLTVDMLTLAQRGVFTTTSLLTGDLDFKPLIDALVGMGIKLTLIYPRGQTNEELIEAADRARPITIEWIESVVASDFIKCNPLPRVRWISGEQRPVSTPRLHMDRRMLWPVFDMLRGRRVRAHDIYGPPERA